MARWNHRTTLPQLRCAQQLPQRGSRERLRGQIPFNRVLAKPWGYGRFSSPLRNSECLTAPTHRTTLPQSRPLGVTAPSEREPGTPSSGRMPFIVPPGNRNVAGDFHRPYGDSECLTAPIHWREQKFLVFSYVSCVIRQIVVKWGKIYPAVPAGGG